MSARARPVGGTASVRWRFLASVAGSLALSLGNMAEVRCAASAHRPGIDEIAKTTARVLPEEPLYDGEIPGSIEIADEEQRRDVIGGLGYSKVSRPTYTVHLPTAQLASGAAIVLFPGGGYEVVSYEFEGTRIAHALQDRGIVAIVVKYRLPSDRTMREKSIGPLQDAQRALRVARARAAEWGVDPHKIGVMGFSAGGHLASTVATHFDKDYSGGKPADADLRPDFSILIYPVITMGEKGHAGSRTALLGAVADQPTREFLSNERWVTARTPPALLVSAGDDSIVDADNSIAYYEALRRNGVPAGLVMFPEGEHGFLLLPMDAWMEPVWAWMERSGLVRP
jgi:acetyl esterase/lipase